MAADEEKKLEVLYAKENQDDETCMTFIFRNEDHTLGNALKHVISQYPEVEFCGYNVPHPLEGKILFRIQTRHGHSADEVLRKGLSELDHIFGEIRKKFEVALDKFESQNPSETT